MKNIILTVLLFTSFSVIGSENISLGKWIITKEENKLTDKIDYFAILPPESGDGALVLRCVDNKTDVFLATDDFISLDDYSKVTIRIDGKKAYTERWEIGGDNDTLFPLNPIQFIKKINNSNKLIIGYKPYSRTQAVSEFKIDHIDEVSKSVSKYCGWKL